MDLKKCSNGHFYDADAYVSCPHCLGAESAPTSPLPDAGFVSFNDALTEAIDPGLDATVSLKDLVNDSKTPAANNVQEDQLTESFYAKAIGSDPVVGWLVCVEGKHFGEFFKLSAGKNFIGRSSNMDVCLSGDSLVSRDKHGIILFEPNSNLFIVQSGESKGLTYHNNNLVLSAVELKAYDEIRVGETKLIFVPLCSDKFSWNNYKNNQTNE